MCGVRSHALGPLRQVAAASPTERYVIHPATELRRIDADIGYGVFATEAIPRGTITWIQDPLDQILLPEQVEALGPRYGDLIERYTFVNRHGQRILCWDSARLMNHSCEANSMSPGLPFEIAVRDITLGEQLTCDYGSLNLERAFTCRCGSWRCRGTIRPEDYECCAPAWDAALREAFAFITQVRQPLWDWVNDVSIIEAGLADPTRIPSILSHRWPRTIAADNPTQPGR